MRVRTVAHVSDLHFGREDPRAEGALLRDLVEVAPSLVAVSGDVTQRARVREFVRARDFLVRVPAPLLVVPGNHDVPLLDVVRRLARPLARYREYVSGDLEPVYEDEELVAIGISTARSLTWKGGRISWEQMERVRARLSAEGPGRLRVLVAHHPFTPPGSSPGEAVVGRADAALAAFGACGLDVLLTGHLPRGPAESLHRPGHTLSRSVLALHAGSAISRCVPGEANTYNLLRVRGARLEVELRAFTGERFEAVKASTFLRTDSGWVWSGDQFGAAAGAGSASHESERA